MINARPLPPAVPPKRGTHGPQVALYDRCLARWGKAHDFMAFIDTDEFLVLRDGTPNLPTLVRAAEGCRRRAGRPRLASCRHGQLAGSASLPLKLSVLVSPGAAACS